MDQSELDAQFEADIASLLGERGQDENLGLHKSFRKLKKSLKKRVKFVAKTVKKVAPYAAAAAAMYYGAPYALMAAKSVGGAISGGYARVKNMVTAAPMVAGEMGPPEPQSSFMSPKVLGLATQFAKRELSRGGVNMRSPQAQVALNRYMTGTMQNMQRRVAPTPATDISKFILPAVAAGGAILMMKG